MFSDSIEGASRSSDSSMDATYDLKLLPGRSNECLDHDLDSINQVLDALLTRGLPYDPYGTRFNGLQGDAEVFRTLYPRPLPGEIDAMTTKTLSRTQWDTVERLKNGLVQLRADLMRAASLYDQITSSGPAEPAADAHQSWLNSLETFVATRFVAASPVAAPRRARAQRVDVSSALKLLLEDAMTALRQGRLDDAERNLGSLGRLWLSRKAEGAFARKLATAVAGS